MGNASRFEDVMPTFVIVFVVVESLVKKQCKGKSLGFSPLH
jgi:hypothetical protein